MATDASQSATGRHQAWFPPGSSGRMSSRQPSLVDYSSSWSSARHRITRSTACPVTSPARPRPSAVRPRASRPKSCARPRPVARTATPIARRSFIGAAGASVVGGLGYLVYLGVGRQEEPQELEVPRTERGLATAKANQGGIPKQVLSDASWTYGGGRCSRHRRRLGARPRHLLRLLLLSPAPSSRASTPRRSTSF